MATRGRAFGIIPARGGSKGVLRKNLHLLGGVPLLIWTLAAARRANLTSCLVTTDDDEIITAAIRYGVGFIRRGARLAGDDTPDLPVFQHVARAMNLRWQRTDIFVHLRPTAPFHGPEDINDVVSRLRAHATWSSIRSVRPVTQHPSKMYRLVGGLLRPYLTHGHAPNHPRQQLPTVWLAAGFVDAVRVPVVLQGSMEGTRIGAWPVEGERCVDLDTEEDFRLAEALAKRNDWHPGHIT